jgi:hypothetical protein
MFWSLCLLLSIIGVLTLQKNILIFEPIILYSLYDITSVFAIWYMIATDMKTNAFIQFTVFHSDVHILLSIASFYNFIGYICVLCGYYICRTRKSVNFKNCIFSKKTSGLLLNGSSFILISIGILNFIYNALNFIKSPDLLNLYLSVNSIKESGTTIGYFFAEAGLYLFSINRLMNNKKNGFRYYVLCLVVIIIKIVNFRIFGTLVTILILYALNSIEDYSNSKKIVKNILLIGCLGISLYFFRMASTLDLSDPKTLNVFFSSLQEILYFAFDKGNTPNIGVFMKIIDSWGRDIGYQFGLSLIIPLLSVLPQEYWLTEYFPAVLIKKTWYLNIPGGNLPSTGIGEMYANFSFLGPFIGMFFFGSLGAILYNYLEKKTTYLRLLIYLHFTISFYMLYPKGEFNNISFLMPICIIIIYTFLHSFQKTLLKHHNN